MKRFFRRGAIVAVCILAACVTTWAGPLTTRRASLPDEQLALANMRKVGLRINDLPHEMLISGLTRQKLEKVVKKQLTDAGFQIADDDTTPRLVLTPLILADESVRDTIGFIVFLDIQQRVRVLRLNEEYVVPTATLSAHGIAKRAALSEAVRERLEETTREFISYEKTATANR